MIQVEEYRGELGVGSMKGVIEVRLSDLDGVNVRLPLDVDVIGQMQQWMVEESC